MIVILLTSRTYRRDGKDTSSATTRFEATFTFTLPLQAGGVGILYGLALLVHIGIIIRTYNDTSANSDQPVFFWTIVVLLAALLGILLYLLLGRR